jgi:acetolactate synthase-1/2/3 large subunit
MKGYAAVAELVRRGGFPTVFSMLGGTNVPWIAAGVGAGSLRLVKTRHEDAAIGAAVGYARSTGRPGLCSVTRGPGFTNAITSLVAAVKSHVPILLIVGESPTIELPSQNVDQKGIARAIGAGFRHVEAAEQLEHAFYSSLLRVHWDNLPQILSVNSSVFGAEVELRDEQLSPELTPHRPPDPAAVARVVSLLSSARRPLLLAGAAVIFADCRDDIVHLAELAGARLATTLRANNLFEGHPANLGFSGGWSPAPIRRELEKADLVLAFGASLNDHTTDHGAVFPHAQLIHCEIDDDHGYQAVQPDLILHSDVSSTVEALLAEWQRQALPEVAAEPVAVSHIDIREAITAVNLHHDSRRGLDPREVYARLDDLMPADRIVVTDSGRFLGTLPSLVKSKDATSWLVGNSYSCIGLGLGSAIGACAAHPDRPVVLFAGDGGFMMSSHDLDAVRLNGLNLTIVVVDDEQYGSDVKHLAKYGLSNAVITQSLPDVVALAQAFGGIGRVVRRLADLDGLDFNRPGLQIVDVRVDPEVNVRDA